MDLQMSVNFNNLEKNINFNIVIDIYSKPQLPLLNIILEKWNGDLIFGRN